jgi:2,3-bisphosphoglycerate-independent phosphoglycerate mutase
MLCPTLRPCPNAPATFPTVLAIMDGIGQGKKDLGDAVAAAATPNLDRYATGPLSFSLAAPGTAVGMPSNDDMGNSEVGHNALGAGRIFDQGAKRVAEAIASGDVFRADIWQKMVGHSCHQRATLHFIGLLSDGNVHSHIDHLLAMLQRADSEQVPRVRVHILLDGRDVGRTSALTYVDRLEALLAQINRGANRSYAIASGGGRMVITMDRYGADWPMVARGWQTHVQGRVGPASDPLAPCWAASAGAAIAAQRAANPSLGDQDLLPFVVGHEGQPIGPIRDGDCVIAFNFRGDRMLQWVRATEEDDFSQFIRPSRPKVLFAGMTQYDGDTQRPKHFLVSPPTIDCTVSELLCGAGVRQLACSETQKFGHVTYFWSGNRSLAFDNHLEEAVEIPSLSLPFAQQPQMRAQEITNAVLQRLQAGRCNFARLNYANGDMVGHTGDFAATVLAVQEVDRCLGILETAVLALGGMLVVTADHGNAEDMVERDKKTGVPLRDAHNGLIAKTSHSLNPVPLHFVGSPALLSRLESTRCPQPGLGNLAATLCVLLGFVAPEIYLPPLLCWRHKS